MAEHEKYLEKAHESLESAEILFEKEKYNTSISQAYYAMFYASKALLSLKRIYPKTHKGMVSEFGLKFVIEGGWVTVYDRDPEYYYIHYLTDMASFTSTGVRTSFGVSLRLHTFLKVGKYDHSEREVCGRFLMM